MDVVARFDVWLVRLDPVQGSEIAKIRPALVVSPDQMNRHLNTVIVCPMTTTTRKWPTRHAVTFAGKSGDIAIDQLRAVDKNRLVKRLGVLPEPDTERVAEILEKLFRL